VFGEFSRKGFRGNLFHGFASLKIRCTSSVASRFVGSRPSVAASRFQIVFGFLLPFVIASPQNVGACVGAELLIAGLFRRVCQRPKVEQTGKR
jgi:hypothetical protein